ncbi:MAG: hypothetical protein CMN21_05010 [Rubinisphaera sp.]|nr:hypothetical protein [Rubinisphaera sp.]
MNADGGKLQVSGAFPGEAGSHIQPPDKMAKLLDVVSGRSHCDPLNSFSAGPHGKNVLHHVDFCGVQVCKLTIWEDFFEKINLPHLGGSCRADSAFQISMLVLK